MDKNIKDVGDVRDIVNALSDSNIKLSKMVSHYNEIKDYGGCIMLSLRPSDQYLSDLNVSISLDDAKKCINNLIRSHNGMVADAKLDFSEYMNSKMVDEI